MPNLDDFHAFRSTSDGAEGGGGRAGLIISLKCHILTGWVSEQVEGD